MPSPYSPFSSQLLLVNIQFNILLILLQIYLTNLWITLLLASPNTQSLFTNILLHENIDILTSYLGILTMQIIFQKSNLKRCWNHRQRIRNSCLIINWMVKLMACPWAVHEAQHLLLYFSAIYYDSKWLEDCPSYFKLNLHELYLNDTFCSI